MPSGDGPIPLPRLRPVVASDLAERVETIVDALNALAHHVGQLLAAVARIEGDVRSLRAELGGAHARLDSVPEDVEEAARDAVRAETDAMALATWRARQAWLLRVAGHVAAGLALLALGFIGHWVITRQ